MKVFYQDTSYHNPPYEIWNGEQTPHQEIPDRAKNILKALKKTSHEIVNPQEEVPESALYAVHSKEYVTYLKGLSKTITDDTYYYPSVFGIRASKSLPTNCIAQRGYFCFDMYTPVSRRVYEAAAASATSAYAGAQALSDREKVVYALSRPPGHHAEKDQMGGYCYFNNAAVAAQFLSKLGAVAVLDVDFHHGNGTQHIFYERNDVLTISLHADPTWKFPHMSGFSEEVGQGKGKGYNLNVCLQQGTTNEIFQRALEQAMENIQKFNPDFFIICFGADTHESDPIGGFKLTTNYFKQMAKSLSEIGLPTLIIQEGGYNNEFLGENIVSFLSGFES